MPPSVSSNSIFIRIVWAAATSAGETVAFLKTLLNKTVNKRLQLHSLDKQFWWWNSCHLYISVLLLWEIRGNKRQWKQATTRMLQSARRARGMWSLCGRTTLINGWFSTRWVFIEPDLSKRWSYNAFHGDFNLYVWCESRAIPCELLSLVCGFHEFLNSKWIKLYNTQVNSKQWLILEDI